jgi:hypothetical protein
MKGIANRQKRDVRPRKAAQKFTLLKARKQGPPPRPPRKQN